jgi:hypothetical protein
MLKTQQLHSGLDKRKNGIFYTPPEVTRILCDWAIRSATDEILEPGFGGCEFLSSSKKRLLALNCSTPEENLFGCDVDLGAFDYLSRIMKLEEKLGHFIRDDYLKIQPADFAVHSFVCALGNPPYVSHHNMSHEQRNSATAALEADGIRLKYKPSLWAYFVLHSLRFLRVGGRAAWVLPSSFLHADYATEVRDLLRERFRRSLAIVLGERLFLGEGTEERTVVLLCEGYCGEIGSGTMEVGFAQTLTELESIVSGWHRGIWKGESLNGKLGMALMDKAAAGLYRDLANRGWAKKLGDLCKIKIGLVTGANKFFVINKATAMSAKLPNNALSYVLAKFGDASGIIVLKKDMEKLRSANKRCLLVDTSSVNRVPRQLQNYLDGFSEDERKGVGTFSKRELWHQPNDGQTPDAFFPYMQHDGPAILLNRASITCTNTIHRIYFNDSVTRAQKKLAAISIQSTFSQLSAEIEGRSYGSGVLKHEPSEAARILLLLPAKVEECKVTEVFTRIDLLLRKGLKTQARAVADELVFSNCSERERRKYLTVLEQSLTDFRAKRMRSSSKKLPTR